MLYQNVKLIKDNYKGTKFMKIKLLAMLTAFFLISGCSATDEYVGTDATFFDNTFKEIPTHDSIDCFGSCTVKIYNR